MSPRGWVVSVVIPARDEAASIAACVRSVIASCAEAGRPFEVTVVADSCLDSTHASALAALAGHGRVVETRVASVGAARRIGVARSVGALAAPVDPDRHWLLSTDADSTVPTDWVRAHLRHADEGAHGVAGTVVVDSFSEHEHAVGPAFHRRYSLGLDAGHGHVHGTNLGVRGDAYLRAGGWQAVVTGEDHDLWQHLKATGEPLVSTVDAPVRTSGRRHGRAPDGFAGLLRSLAGPGATRDIAR